MWISAGDHELSDNIIHLVLARSELGVAGVKGLSLFVVPKYVVTGGSHEPNDVSTFGLNHKMGYRGTTNAALGFGEGRHRPAGQPGAIGYLVGEPGRGLEYMFHMMNEARIGVGLSATCLGYSASIQSDAYANFREQGRPTGVKGGRQVPIARHPDVQRMLRKQKSYVEGSLALILFCARLLDDAETHPAEAERAVALQLLDVLTPIAKSWPSQWCLAANDIAIQIHSGNGYTRDYDLEQRYRDNRLNSIHEGTHGIQGIDLLGRRVRNAGGAGYRQLIVRMDQSCARAAALGGLPSELAGQLSGYRRELASSTEQLTTLDRADSLRDASLYLEAFGHVVLGWIWLEQVIAAHEQVGTFYERKRQTCWYFFAYELPNVAAWFGIIKSSAELSIFH